MAKFIYRLLRGRAASQLWFVAWFNSPHMKANTDRYLRHLELAYNKLNRTPR